MQEEDRVGLLCGRRSFLEQLGAWSGSRQGLEGGRPDKCTAKARPRENDEEQSGQRPCDERGQRRPQSDCALGRGGEGEKVVRVMSGWGSDEMLPAGLPTTMNNDRTGATEIPNTGNSNCSHYIKNNDSYSKK